MPTRDEIVEQDIMTCPAHPEGMAEGCADCDAIAEVWADEIEQISSEIRAAAKPAKLKWHPSARRGVDDGE